VNSMLQQILLEMLISWALTKLVKSPKIDTGDAIYSLAGRLEKRLSDVGQTQLYSYLEEIAGNFFRRR
jgi:hypothetical protein